MRCYLIGVKVNKIRLFGTKPAVYDLKKAVNNDDSFINDDVKKLKALES